MACSANPVCHREARFAPWRFSWIASSQRDAASVNELTLFAIAKEPRRLRQSTGAIDQLDRHVASLLAMTIAKMLHCPITQRLGVGPRSRNDRFENAPSI
jgi:hypothetical protein